MKPMRVVSFALAITLVAGMVGTAIAQRASVPHVVRPPDKAALGLDEVKQLLLLMDTDKNGKISKQEFMRFVEAKFDRLDKERSGELDIKEMRRSLVASRSTQTPPSDRK